MLFLFLFCLPFPGPKILKRVQKVFAPHVMEVVSVSFYTCPVFYAAMQHRSPEWQSMANRLVVIYEPTNADFYSALSNRSRISASRTHLEVRFYRRSVAGVFIFLLLCCFF